MPRRFHRGRRKESAMQVAKRALRQVRRPRLRWDLQAHEPAFTIAWQSLLMNKTTVGDGSNDREGDIVKMSHISLKYFITGGTALGAAAVVRIMLVMDKQANGLAIDPNDVFTSTNSITSHIDPSLSRKYRILYDKSHVLQEYASNTSVLSKAKGGFDRRYKSPLTIRYNNAQDDTILSLSSGAIWLLFITENSTAPPTLNIKFQSRFYSP